VHFGDALNLGKSSFTQAIFKDGSTDWAFIDDRNLQARIPLFPRQ
jgi:hypothetical protein